MGKVLIIVLKILKLLLLVPFSSNMKEITLRVNKTTVVNNGKPNGTRKILSRLSEVIVINT